MWREDTAEIDAWLAKEKAELDAAFPDLTLSAILRDTASLVPDWPTLPNDWP